MADQKDEVVRRLYHELETVVDALDDASTVVDPGEDEEYAYQHELESARKTIEETKPAYRAAGGS
jgi:hypothetical protein